MARRRAVDTRRREKVGTRKMFGRILITFLLIAGVSIGLVGRIMFLNKKKGTAYE